jgi:hypothetical protein
MTTDDTGQNDLFGLPAPPDGVQPHDTLPGQLPVGEPELGAYGVPVQDQAANSRIEEYAGAWRDFGLLPGTHLWWVRAGAVRRELRTAEQLTICSFRGAPRYGRPPSFSTGGRAFISKRVTETSWPGIAEIVVRSRLDWGCWDFLDPKTGEPGPGTRARLQVREVLDETGIPILYSSGRHFGFGDGACVTFPDGRWIRFPVRGTKRANAIMTAVDQAGDEVARYRIIGSKLGRTILWNAIEITVSPGQELTDELVLANAISAPWLSSYFVPQAPAGG